MEKNSDLVKLKDDGLEALSDWKRASDPFAHIAALNLEDEIKDRIVLWWKENPKTLEQLAELHKISTSINLPKNEAKDAQDAYSDALELAKDVNSGLIAFNAKEGRHGAFAKILNVYAQTYHLSPAENTARNLDKTIQKYADQKEDMLLIMAVSKAIIETRGSNRTEQEIRKKVAQYALTEMFEQMVAGRLDTLAGSELEPTGVLDTPYQEKIDLTSVLSSPGWTAKERAKMLRNVNRLKRVMNNLEADTEDKRGLTALWRWANGVLPKDTSAWQVLLFAHNLDVNITDTVSETWQNEAEAKEDEEEVE